MTILKFECIDEENRISSVRIDTPLPDDEVLRERWIGRMRAAYEEVGIEVLTINRVEELLMDADVPAGAAFGAAAVRRRTLHKAAGHAVAIAGVAGLVMSIVGFDHGFSIVNLMSHVRMVAHLA